MGRAAMVFWKPATTAAARKAVPRLTMSQMTRVRKE